MQPFLPWKSNKYDIFWVCNCSLRYQVCNVHAPYCSLWPARLYNIIHIISQTIRFSRKKIINLKCVFCFSLHLFSETFLILRPERDMIKNLCWSSCKISVIIVRLNETSILSIHFQKILKYQISWKSLQWEPSFSTRTDGWTDRRNEANSRFSKFCQTAYKLRMCF